MVSIIVTTYNRKTLLKETIDSILCQTYQDFELIVVDNFSEYDFMEYIKSFASEKIKGYQNQNNGVIAVNRNYGIDKAKGEYIAFCDDDDLWMPNKLEQQMNYIKKYDVDFISTGLVFFNSDYVSKTIYRPYKNKYDVYLKSNITPSTVLLKKTPDVRFDEDPNINGAEDWELFAKLITLGYKFYQMPTAAVKYRLLDNTSNKITLQPHLRAIRLLNILKKKCGKKFKLSYYLFAFFYHMIFLVLHKVGFVKIIKYLKRSIYA